MRQTARFTPSRDSRLTGSSAGVSRWVDTWHDRASVFSVTFFVTEDGGILPEDDPRVQDFKTAEGTAIKEFSAVANQHGIKAALEAVPSIR